MQPTINKIQLSLGRSTDIITFSIEEVILRMINNKSVFTPNNFPLNSIHLCSDPPKLSHYGKVNLGSWFRQKNKRNATYQITC